MLQNPAYEAFHASKKKTGKVFCEVYKTRSIEDVANELREGGISEDFIQHASTTWAKMKSKPSYKG